MSERPLTATDTPPVWMLGEKLLRNEPSPHASPHASALVVLTQRASVRGQLGQAREVLSEPRSRESFFRLARELGVEGLALNTLAASTLTDSLPADVMRELDTRRERLRRQALLWDLERDRVLQVLWRRDIAPLLLKGSALRECVYDDALDRSMGDLDLLVAADDIDRAMAALVEAGYTTESDELKDAYRQHHFHHVLRHPRGFIVELHWGLTDPGSRVPLNERQFLARSSMSNRATTVPVRVPSPEDLLLHAVSQNEDDAFGLLRRIVDIDRIVAKSPHLDWLFIARAARESGLDLVLAVSLRLAQLLLGTDVPAELSRGSGLPVLSRLHLAMMHPVAWVVSLPSQRRDAASDAIRLWCARTWSARGRRAVESFRGAEALEPIHDGTDAPSRRPWRMAESGIVRATKLGLYHLVIYWRSGLSLASATGRRRLRFWS